MMQRVKNIARPITSSVSSFIDDNCFQFSAAVSFYTLFSLAPVVLIAIYVAGFFASDEIIVHELNRFFSEFFGPQSTDGLMLLIDNIQSDDQSILALTIGVFILLFSATNLFIQLKESFNQIFDVRTKKGKGIIKLFIDRLVSLSMIALLGIALIISLLLDSIAVSFFNFMSDKFNFLNLIFASIGGNLVTLFLVFTAILLLFTVLPDVKLKLRDLVKGSLVTAFLLTIGKFIIGWIIGKSSFTELSGASSTIIILMLWIYYSSVILFFGIELVKALSESKDWEIRPKKYSTRIRFIEVDED